MADRLTEEERADVIAWAERSVLAPMRDEYVGGDELDLIVRTIFELHEENARLREAGNHDVADLIAARDAAFEQRDALEERIREALDALPVHEKSDRYHPPRCGTCWERWPCDIAAARMALSPTHYAKTEGVTP